MRRVGVVVLSVAVIGCTDFVGTEGGGDDGGSSSSTSNSGGTTGTPVGTSVATQGGSGGTTTGPGTASTDPSAGTSDDSTTDATTNADSGSTDDTQGLTTGPSGSSTTGDPTQGGEDSTSTTSDECIELDQEPNDIFADSVVLDAQYCDDDPSTFQGTLLEPDDVDRYRFSSPWDCGVGSPRHNYEVTGPVEICASASCNFLCSPEDYVQINGYDYCCSTATLSVDLFCGQQIPDSTGFLVVRRTDETPECAEYSVDYAVEDVD
jgi:hypothetical protein